MHEGLSAVEDGLEDRRLSVGADGGPCQRSDCCEAEGAEPDVLNPTAAVLRFFERYLG